MIQEHSKYNINLFDYCTCLEIGIKNVGGKIYLLDGQAQMAAHRLPDMFNGCNVSVLEKLP